MSAPTPGPDTPQGPGPRSSAAAQQQDSQAAGSASSQQTDQVRSLATTLAVPSTPGSVFLKGVVTATDLAGSPPTITITLGGDTVAIANVRFMDAYSPVVGDTVVVSKQGSDLLVWGQMMDTTAGSGSGWTAAPTLSSGYTTNGNSNGNLEYRLVIDNGDVKIQWRGSVARTSGGTTIFTMPTGFRPVTKRSLLVSRDMGGGSNVEQLDFNTDGTVVRVGSTVAPAAATGDTGSASPGTNDPGTHRHWMNADGNHPAPYDFTDYNGSHTHTVNSHTHSMSSHTHAVAAPTWIGFNNVEYFL